jgi:hypothetical protein
VEQRLLRDVAALQPGLLAHQTDVLRWVHRKCSAPECWDASYVAHLCYLHVVHSLQRLADVLPCMRGVLW